MANTEVPADTLPVRYGYAVSRCHTGSCITFRRAHRNARLQVCRLHPEVLHLLQSAYLRLLRQTEPPAESLAVSMDILFALISSSNCLYHLLVIIYGFRIDREHTGSIADTQNSLPGQFPVDIAGQCSDKMRYLLHALLRLRWPDTDVRCSISVEYC